MRETSACAVCVLSAIKRARVRYHNGESNALFFPERDASEESASFTFALSLDDKHSSMAPRTRGRNSNNNKSSSAEKNEKENEKKKKTIKRKKNEEEEEENNDRLDVEDIAKRVKRASIGKKEEAREEEERVLRGGSRDAEEARGEEEEEKVPPSSSSSLSLASYAEINSVLKRLHFEARERRRTSMSP